MNNQKVVPFVIVSVDMPKRYLLFFDLLPQGFYFLLQLMLFGLVLDFDFLEGLLELLHLLERLTVDLLVFFIFLCQVLKAFA